MVERNTAEGRRILFADAEDQMFWQSPKMNDVKAVIPAMNDPEAKIISTRKLRESGFGGLIVSHAMYEDIAQRIRSRRGSHLPDHERGRCRPGGERGAELQPTAETGATIRHLVHNA